MDVDTSIFRKIQDCLRDDLSKSCHNDDIRCKSCKCLHKFRITYFGRLVNRNFMFHGFFFDRSWHKCLASSLRFVRLCHNCRDLISGFYQCGKRRHCKIRSSHINYFHNMLLFSSVIRNPQIPHPRHSWFCEVLLLPGLCTSCHRGGRSHGRKLLREVLFLRRSLLPCLRSLPLL